jgi:hypothetical protein
MCVECAGDGRPGPRTRCNSSFALCKQKRTVSYGSVTSDIRAILGLVFSSVAILLWGGLILFVSLSRFR